MIRPLLFASLLLGCTSLFGQPVDTPVTVRVRAHDAKFVGSHVGGVNLVFEDADTGKLLASGTITGGTGDTARLIERPATRGERLADDDTAGFTAVLPLERPTRLRIRAVGPLATVGAPPELSVTTWVVPGRPITGDGIVLQLPGLIVTPQPITVADGRATLAADVTLACGCPISADGLWPAADYEVVATLTPEHGEPITLPLAFVGPNNRFAAATAIAPGTRYRATVWAYNGKTGNTGVAEAGTLPASAGSMPE